MPASRLFNPLELWPARVGTQKIPVDAVHGQAKNLGGATGYDKDGKVVLVNVPTENTAYCRVIRRHEALHAIYSDGRKKYSANDMLHQALEDARIHYNHSKARGGDRRDELVAALTDLKHGAGKDKGLLPLLVLRSAAILDAKNRQGTAPSQYQKIYDKRCNEVSPEFQQAVKEALAAIGKENMALAERILSPHFSDARERQQSFPNGGKSEAQPKKDKKDKKDEKPEDGEPEDGEPEDGEPEESDNEAIEHEREETTEYNPEVKEVTLTAEDTPELLSATTIESLKTCHTNITMTTHDLAAFDNIPTFFGETEKLVPSGSRIKAKKLATIVGPGCHRVFTKTINLRGGSILIDASGSMKIDNEDLLRICQTAPMATLAFYNAPHDSKPCGNLWVFANKARRAADLSLVKMAPRGLGVRTPADCFGTGNVIDLLALQWLLKQPTPRYFVTDCGWTGPEEYVEATRELFRNAVERKLITQVWSEAQAAYGDAKRTLQLLDRVIQLRGKCKAYETMSNYQDAVRADPSINPALAARFGLVRADSSINPALAARLRRGL